LRKEPDWLEVKKKVVDPLASAFGGEFIKEEVEKAEGIIFVNGMALPAEKGEKKRIRLFFYINKNICLLFTCIILKKYNLNIF